MGRVILWNDKEIKTLKEVYPLGKEEEICKAIPNRGWNNIKAKAANLKIKRKGAHSSLYLMKLLEETHEAYYWMGFIAADGCFVKEGETLTVGLGDKDFNHLQKYAKFLDIEAKLYKHRKACSCSLNGRAIINLIMDKFDLRPRKTYNPPKTISWMRPDLALSFLIGYIDGDGFIMKNVKTAYIGFHIHSSWLNILEEFRELIKKEHNSDTNPPSIYPDGYLFYCISRFEAVKKLKNHAIEHNLPILERKWSKIDENKISVYEMAEYRKKEAKKMHSEGFTNDEIAKKLGIAPKRVVFILEGRIEHRTKLRLQREALAMS